eukprot:jgi/Psemu1/306998/fgenesh1_kg.296_\
MNQSHTHETPTIAHFINAHAHYVRSRSRVELSELEKMATNQIREPPSLQTHSTLSYHRIHAQTIIID